MAKIWRTQKNSTKIVAVIRKIHEIRFLLTKMDTDKDTDTDTDQDIARVPIVDTVAKSE